MNDSIKSSFSKEFCLCEKNRTKNYYKGFDNGKKEKLTFKQDYFYNFGIFDSYKIYHGNIPEENSYSLGFYEGTFDFLFEKINEKKEKNNLYKEGYKNGILRESKCKICYEKLKFELTQIKEFYKNRKTIFRLEKSTKYHKNNF